MNLQKLISDSHAMAASKGFWQDIDKPWMRDQALALIISELGEALEAHRKGKRARLDNYLEDLPKIGFEQSFKDFIKDSLEDEMADTCIRIFDLAGAYGSNPDKIDYYLHKELDAMKHLPIENVPQNLFYIMRSVSDYRFIGFKQQALGESLGKIQHLANKMNFNLLWHIEKKMQYNSTRPFKHGKQF